MKQYKTEETLLFVDKISVGYNGKTIIKDVSFTEHNITREGFPSTGQVIAFIGRSGRGKSTLFKALTGVLKPTSGQILITDMDSEAKDDAKAVSEGDIGFVDQKYTLLRHETILQICQYALREQKMTKVEKEALINTYLNEWGLQEHKNKYSCELSGGQRQRTAIIEQMLSSKHFMILDEPFSGLDVGNIDKVKESFERISAANEFNITIFSTHDIKLAVEMADSIYILGFPEGETEVSTIVGHYDLKAMGLSWIPYGEGHRQLCADIRELLLRS